MSNSARDQIAKFLSLGLSQSEVAAKLSVSPGLVSQIANEDTIKQKVTEAQLAFLDAATERDNRYNELEDELLEKAKKALPMIYKPQDIMRALMAINKAERRGASSQQMAEILSKKDAAVIDLELPERLKTKLVKSHTREVIEINGRKLITKDSRLLYQDINTLAEAEADPLDIDLPEINSNKPLELSDGTGIQQLPGANPPALTISEAANAVFSNKAEPDKVLAEHRESSEANERPELEPAFLFRDLFQNQ